jgi:hypothetical protein
MRTTVSFYLNYYLSKYCIFFNESFILNQVPAVSQTEYSNDDFELINNEIKQADDAVANDLADDLSGILIN